MADLTIDGSADAPATRARGRPELSTVAREAAAALRSPRVIAAAIVVAAAVGVFGAVQVDADLQRQRTAELGHISELQRALDAQTAANGRLGFEVARLGAAIAERMTQLESTEGLLR